LTRAGSTAAGVHQATALEGVDEVPLLITQRDHRALAPVDDLVEQPQEPQAVNRLEGTIAGSGRGRGRARFALWEELHCAT